MAQTAIVWLQATQRSELKEAEIITRQARTTRKEALGSWASSQASQPATQPASNSTPACLLCQKLPGITTQACVACYSTVGLITGTVDTAAAHVLQQCSFLNYYTAMVSIGR